MATTILYPNGDGTHTGTVTGTEGPPYYTNIDEGTVSPDDVNFVSLSSNPAIAAFELTNLPSDAVTITDVTIRVRVSNSSKGRKIDSVQILQSNQSTAITAVAPITASTTMTTYSVSPSITGATDKTTWDSARLIVNGSGSSGIVSLAAVQIDITYSTSGGAATTSTSFLIGF